jgi:hypothetical protein
MARYYIWKYLFEQKYYKIRTFCTKVHGVVSLVSGAKQLFLNTSKYIKQVNINLNLDLPN